MVIKVTDDYLDEVPQGPSLAAKLDRGVTPYGLLLFSLAVSLDPGTVCTLFLAAYAVGMIKDPDLLLPTSLPTWAESLMVSACGTWLWGWRAMVSSLIIMAVVQLGDDYLDRDQDWQQQRFNLANRWGRVETLLLILLLGYLSLLLDWEKTLMVLALTPVVNLVVAGLGKRRLWA